MKQASSRGVGHADMCVRAFSDALQRSTTLSALQLQWNKLGDTGARQIGAGIEGGAVLRQLDLSFNDVTGAGCDALARGLVASKHMTDVLLSGNPAIGLTGVVSLLSGIDPEGPVTRILVQGCGLSARDGAMAEIVAPEIGAASDAAKVTLRRIRTNTHNTHTHTSIHPYIHAVYVSHTHICIHTRCVGCARAHTHTHTHTFILHPFIHHTYIHTHKHTHPAV